MLEDEGKSRSEIESRVEEFRNKAASEGSRPSSKVRQRRIQRIERD